MNDPMNVFVVVKLSYDDDYEDIIPYEPIVKLFHTEAEAIKYTCKDIIYEIEEVVNDQNIFKENYFVKNKKSKIKVKTQFKHDINELQNMKKLFLKGHDWFFYRFIEQK